MIIVLYGEDTYRARQKLYAVIQRYRQLYPNGLGMHQWEGAAKSSDVKEALTVFPMFREKRLLVFRNMISPSDALLYLEGNVNALAANEDIIAVFFEERALAKNSDYLIPFIGKAALAQEFSLLEGEKLVRWVQNEAKKHGWNMQGNMARLLVRHVGNDLWRMSQEVGKLAAFSRTGDIQEKDVAELVARALDINVFQLVEAIAKKDAKRALELLYGYERQGESLFHLFSRIVSQLRRTLEIKEMQEREFSEQEIAKALKMHPYAFKKNWELAYLFSLPQLILSYRKLFSIDLKTKTGQAELGRELELFVTRG